MDEYNNLNNQMPEEIPTASEHIPTAADQISSSVSEPVSGAVDPGHETVYLNTEATADTFYREAAQKMPEETASYTSASADPSVSASQPQYQPQAHGSYNDYYTSVYGNSYSYYDTNENYGSPQTTAQPVYSQDFTKQTPAETKKKKRRGGRVWFALLCILLSLISGFGGAYVYSKYFAEKPTVIYQSVESGNASPMVAENTSLADVIDLLKPSVVEVQTEIMTTGSFFGQSIGQGAGSGVVLSSDGYIATNYHVIKGANSIKVITTDSKEYKADVVGFDETHDLAVIKIDASGLSPVTIADSSAVRVGDTAIAIGNPLGTLGGTVTTGIVSALDREIEVEGQSMVLMQTNAAVSPGNSGGGLFNINGELIGIVNAKSSAEYVEGLGFAIPSDIVSEITADIMENQTTVHASNGPIFGITVVTVSDSETAASYNVSRFGVYIVAVTRGYGGDKAGLEVGDYIVSVDGTAISDASEITEILSQHEAGEKLELQIIRNGRIMTFNVELMNYND